jgi:hypothetical protein
LTGDKGQQWMDRAGGALEQFAVTLDGCIHAIDAVCWTRRNASVFIPRRSSSCSDSVVIACREWANICFVHGEPGCRSQERVASNKYDSWRVRLRASCRDLLRVAMWP